MVTAPASTGIAAISKKAVITHVQIKSGIFISVMPGARMFIMVAIMLMAPRIDERIENMLRDGTEARHRHMNLIWHLALVKQVNRHGLDDNIVDVIAWCLGFVRRN